MRAKELFEYVQKNKWTLLVSDRDKHYWSKDLIDLVDNAYKHTSLGSFVNSAMDVASSDWVAQDWDQDPEMDCTVFYRKARPDESWSGHKIQGIGHDGRPESKQKVINRVKVLLGKTGWWIESSDAMARTLGKLGMQPLTDEATAQAIFPNTNLKMIDNNGTYQRNIGGGVAQEAIYGNPIVKNVVRKQSVKPQPNPQSYHHHGKDLEQNVDAPIQHQQLGTELAGNRY